jgi:hypothetical protein
LYKPFAEIVGDVPPSPHTFFTNSQKSTRPLFAACRIFAGMADMIQLLTDSVANQIAAGEVLQRPASVGNYYINMDLFNHFKNVSKL